MISKFFHFFILLLMFFIAAGVSAYLALTYIIKSEDTVVLPDLGGKDIIYVLEILTDMELNTKVEGSEYSISVPKNRVIYQNPEPGAEIKKGRDVRLILSKGKRTVKIPNLKGLSIHSALLILEENGLHNKALTHTYYKGYKKNAVITQTPSPGKTAKRGDGVDLLASLGTRPAAYMAPDLRGMSFDDAILLIEKNNMVVGEIKTLFDPHQPEEVIIAQKPLSGERITEGSRVNLLISKKSEKKNNNSIPGPTSAGLFRWRTENGFLKQHIRVRLNSYGVSNDIFDGYVNPGAEIWLLIPNDDSIVLLYVDDKLVKIRNFIDRHMYTSAYQ